MILNLTLACCFLAICRSSWVADRWTTACWIHCECIPGCLLGACEHATVYPGQQGRVIPYYDVKHLYLSWVCPYFVQNLLYCADQSYLAQMLQWMKACPLLKSTLRNLSEFTCNWFQQLVNPINAGCKFFASFCFFSLLLTCLNSSTAAVIYPFYCVAHTPFTYVLGYHLIPCVFSIVLCPGDVWLVHWYPLLFILSLGDMWLAHHYTVSHSFIWFYQWIKIC